MNVSKTQELIKKVTLTFSVIDRNRLIDSLIKWIYLHISCRFKKNTICLFCTLLPFQQSHTLSFKFI